MQAKNNPLAIDDDAPWKKFFEDGEFRKKIDMDVKRTFPELEFFRSDHVQESLINILFCYSRRFPELSYRQGMHELAAIIFLVVYQDRHHEEAVAATAAAAATGAGEAAAASADVRGHVKLVMDQTYIAHDVYAMFSVVMDIASPWFMQHQAKTPKRTSMSKLQPMKDTPFAQFEEPAPNSAILIKLDRIHKVLLKKYDNELFNRLQLLDIAPSIYGLRWLRILFAREFDISKTLRLWDAIFADGPFLELADFVFVSMLCQFRHVMLVNDSMDTMRLLMSPLPETVLVNTIVERALHIRDPKRFPKPQSDNPLTDMTRVSGRPSKQRGRRSQSAAATTAQTTTLPKSRKSSTNSTGSGSGGKGKGKAKGGKGKGKAKDKGNDRRRRVDVDVGDDVGAGISSGSSSPGIRRYTECTRTSSPQQGCPSRGR